MKTQIKKYITFALPAFMMFIYSCTERIELDLDTTNTRLVIEGELTTDTMKHTVILSKSGDALNKLPREAVSGALVTISDGTNTFTLNESPEKPGKYETTDTVHGIPGKVYTLKVQNVDINNDKVLEEYTAISNIKKMLPIDSIKIKVRTFGRKGWFINLYAQDIGGGRNFYTIKAYVNSKLVTDSTFEIGFADNLGFEGKYYDGLSVYMLSNYKKDEQIKTGDTITLELGAVTSGYYYFLYDFISEYYPKMPIFSGPSANITTNIEPKNSSIGYFATYSIERKSVIYK